MDGRAPPPADPRFARRVAAAFAVLLVALLATGIASLVRAPPADWARIGEPARLAGGESGAQLSRILNDRFAARAALQRVERGASYLLLGDLGARVRGGCDGWLFLRDELDIHPDAPASAALRARIAAAVARRLEAAGARLVVAVVPDKSRVERERLCGLRRPPAFEHRVSAWARSLGEAGVTAIDLTVALAGAPGERYYRTDSHWNEAGARTAATALAGELRALGLAPEPAPPPHELPAERVRRPGDLVRVAGIDWLPEPLGPGAEWVERALVPAPAVESDDLFGEAGAPKVALAGSSFSRSASFAAFLAWQLGEPVANVSREGADFDGSARAYLAGPTLREAPPRLVVWEVPERALGQPVKPAEREWLAALEAAAATGRRP